MNEQEQFLKDLLPKEDKLADLFEAPLVPEAKTETEVKDEAEENDEDNREARRAKKVLREERQASIEIANKLAETTERLERLNIAKTTLSESDADYLKGIERIYGTETPEALAATELLKNALQGVEKRAKESALEQFRRENEEATKAVKSEENTLDAMIEDLEDEYDIDLSSSKSEELRKGFYKRLEKLSPKDKDGNIIAFADHRSVWEDYASQIQKRTENTRAKDIASRGLNNSTSTEVKSGSSAEEKFLIENGLI